MWTKHLLSYIDNQKTMEYEDDNIAIICLFYVVSKQKLKQSLAKSRIPFQSFHVIIVEKLRSHPR